MLPTDQPPTIVLYYHGALLLAGIAVLIHAIATGAVRLRGGDSKTISTWDIPWTHFLLFVWVIFSVILLGQVTLRGALEGRIGAFPDPEVIQIIAFGSLFHFSIIGVWLLARINQPQLFEAPLNQHPVSWPRAAGIAMYSILAVLPLIAVGGAVWVLLLELLRVPVEAQKVVEVFMEIEVTALLVLMVLLVVLLAPISEELIFRGGLYRFLKARFSFWHAAISSSVLFSLMHMNVMSFLPLMILGILLCLAYEKSGSLKVPILIHAIFNLNTVIVIVLLQAAGE